MVYNLIELLGLEDKFRIRLINSISGYKGVHLIGTQDRNGSTNVALFNSVVHIGASPPLVGFILRPLTGERHTYQNITETGYYTINHVHKSFVKKAHYTSANFSREDSEFDKCNLKWHTIDGCPAPFVEESRIKFGLKLKEDIEIKSNGTHLIIGEIIITSVEDAMIESDGQIDLELANNVCVTGLNQYSSVSKFIKLPAAKVSELPDFHLKERGDNVVFDTNTQSYHSSILPYGTNIGAPKITATEMTSWKNASIINFNHSFQNKVELLKKRYQELTDEYHTNEMVYKAKMNFEPIVGQIYHLYHHHNRDEHFLSLIPPASWKMEYIGSFKLNHEKLWEKVTTG